jgi:hypothetical protein
MTLPSDRLGKSKIECWLPGSVSKQVAIFPVHCNICEVEKDCKW